MIYFIVWLIGWLLAMFFVSMWIKTDLQDAYNKMETEPFLNLSVACLFWPIAVVVTVLSTTAFIISLPFIKIKGE